ncbi:MAG: ankyrin repeat domain-containing protein [Planctomycetaceae bacterium]|jgi:hypothetical protein|nr:ankyrin repeat domain-containing protein [Planctomycetaceae bacterium]
MSISLEYSKKFQFYFSPTSFLPNFFLTIHPKTPVAKMLLPNNPTSIINPTPEALFDAVQKGDLPKVMDLINAGIDVNTKADLDSTPLHFVVMNNTNVDILNYLVLQGTTSKNLRQTNFEKKFFSTG